MSNNQRITLRTTLSSVCALGDWLITACDRHEVYVWRRCYPLIKDDDDCRIQMNSGDSDLVSGTDDDVLNMSISHVKLDFDDDVS